MKIKGFLTKLGSSEIRQGFIYSTMDGVFWAIMYSFSENFIVPFALFYNAGALLISLIQGMGQLGIAGSQLIGAQFINKYPGFRKNLSLICVTLHAFSWLFLFSITFLTKDPLYIAIFFFFGIFATNFGGPGWISWMNDLVPPKIRGEFWGIRNSIIGFTQVVSIAIAGLILEFGKKEGNTLLSFAILFCVAFLFRFIAIIPLGKQFHPPPHKAKDMSQFKFTVFLTKILTTNFGKFALFSFLMTFSVNLTSSIINIHIINSLHFNYFQFSLMTTFMTISTVISMTYWGPLTDKYGNYRILVVTAFCLPFLILGWAFIHNFILLILLQIASGFVWSGVNLATSNYIFDTVEKQNIPKIIAYFNSLNNISAFSGSILGGILATLTPLLTIHFFTTNNYELIFILSFILRVIVILFFVKKFKEVRMVESSPSKRYFLIYKPVTNVVNQILMLNNRIKEKINSEVRYK